MYPTEKDTFFGNYLRNTEYMEPSIREPNLHLSSFYLFTTSHADLASIDDEKILFRGTWKFKESAFGLSIMDKVSFREEMFAFIYLEDFKVFWR